MQLRGKKEAELHFEVHVMKCHAREVPRLDPRRRFELINLLELIKHLGKIALRFS